MLMRDIRSSATDFPVDHVSASSMIKFSSNPILFRINYINREYYESTTNISAVLGKAFHLALEIYYRTGEDEKVDNVGLGLTAGMEYLDEYNDNWVKYSATIANKQKAKDLLAFMYAEYIKSKPFRRGEVIECEDEILEHVNVEWNGETVKMPIKLKGVIDKVWRGEDGKLRITDYKTAYSFSNPEKIDGAKIIQAIQYYFLCLTKYKEAPYSITFEEVKYTKNRDGSSQLREYEIVYEENKLYFDFYLRFYEDFCRAMIGEQVYVPNVYAMFDNEVSIVSYIHRLDVPENTAELMRRYAVNTITEVLKCEMQNTANMNKLLKMTETLVEEKNINYDDMENNQKIQVKLLEHGMTVHYDGVIEGHTVDLYRYKPSIGLKMSRLLSYVADIEQVMGVSGIRVLAPIPNTAMIGFEVPRVSQRTFPGTAPKNSGFEVAIGVDVMGETVRFDIRKAPHLLVAGSTGSGKSVFLNSIISQIIEGTDAQLHLFDPKIVELAKFAHAADEYLNDAQTIYISLCDLVDEMNRRYHEFARKGARNIEEYGGGMRYKFVIIDEFGDLMMTGEKFKSASGEKLDLSKEISKQILILAQKARAAGIHLIIATQRPSIDIITGSIKANFPTKIAFRTAKAVDSQVLLDETGAEKLLGRGDMIFSGDFGKVRLQGFSE